MGIRLLNKKDISELVSIKEIIEILKNSYLEYANQAYRVPARIILSNKNKQALSLFMPCHLSSPDILGIKVSSIYPNNKELNIPSIHGFVTLLNPETGEIKAMLDSGMLTALRTAGMSGFVTDLVASNIASTVAIIGAGAQARKHLLAMCSVRPIQKINIYSRSHASVDKFIAEMSDQVAVELRHCHSIEEALADADILCTVTSYADQQPLIAAVLLTRGLHINAIGGSNINACEISPQALKNFLIIADLKRGAMEESGEISSALRQGIISENEIYEVKNILGQPKHQIDDFKENLHGTFFKNVGSAFQDVVVAKYILQKAETSAKGMLLNYFE